MPHWKLAVLLNAPNVYHIDCQWIRKINENFNKTIWNPPIITLIKGNVFHPIETLVFFLYENTV